MLRFNLLQHGRLRPGVFRLDKDIAASTIADISTSLNYAYFEVNTEYLLTKQEVLATFAVVMNFPSYFGLNWDAFEECLTNLNLISQQQKGMIIIWDNLAAYAANDHQGFAIAIACLESAVDQWWERNVAMYVLLSGSVELVPVSDLLPEIELPYGLRDQDYESV